MENNHPPKFIMLTLFKNNTYEVDFFSTLEKAEEWKEHDIKQDKKFSNRIDNIIIYAPVKEETKND